MVIAVLINFVRPYLVQAAIAIGILLAIAGAIEIFKVHYTNQGYQQALDDIAADNKEAIDAADKARSRVRNCRDAGGVWDAARGVCDGRRE
ncbi:hypothetical protein ACVWW6_005514 [Bradyrhizobium sp. USDA 3311]